MIDTVGREPGWYWCRRPNGWTPFPCQWNGKVFFDGRYRDDLIVLSKRLKPPMPERTP